MLRAAVTIAALAAGVARGDSVVDRCAGASEGGQRLATDHQLRRAREQLLVCARADCPDAIRRDCDRLLTALDAAMPTVVLAAFDAKGLELTDVRVELDGAPVADALAGRSIAIDPGAHILRFVRGGQVVQRDVIIVEGEHDRRITAGFAIEATSSPRPARAGRHLTWPSVALGSLAVAALGAFAYLAISGQGDYDRCTTTGCDQAAASSVKDRRIGAWASLAVAVGAGAGAYVIYASSEPHGAVVGVALRF
jgi:hypothetical protein